MKIEKTVWTDFNDLTEKYELWKNVVAKLHLKGNDPLIEEYNHITQDEMDIFVKIRELEENKNIPDCRCTKHEKYVKIKNRTISICCKCIGVFGMTYTEWMK